MLACSSSCRWPVLLQNQGVYNIILFLGLARNSMWHLFLPTDPPVPGNLLGHKRTRGRVCRTWLEPLPALVLTPSFRLPWKHGLWVPPESTKHLLLDWWWEWRLWCWVCASGTRTRGFTATPVLGPGRDVILSKAVSCGQRNSQREPALSHISW